MKTYAVEFGFTQKWRTHEKETNAANGVTSSSTEDLSLFLSLRSHSFSESLAAERGSLTRLGLNDITHGVHLHSAQMTENLNRPSFSFKL